MIFLFKIENFFYEKNYFNKKSGEIKSRDNKIGMQEKQCI